MITMQKLAPILAGALCRKITQSLPEWFGQFEDNDRYAVGMANRIALAAFDQDLFNRHTYSPDCEMVYLLKNLHEVIPLKMDTDHV
jgi:hypothetical protein